MSFFKKLFGVAAPIIGGIFGGPLGASIGGAIGGAANGGGLRGALTGGALGFAGGAIGNGLFGSAGAFGAAGGDYSGLFQAAGQGLEDGGFGAAAGAEGGGLYEGAFGGSVMEGGGGAVPPGLGAGGGNIVQNLSQLVQGGDFSMDSIRSALSTPSQFFQRGLGGTAQSALKFGVPLMQLAGGVEGMIQSNKLQKQMQALQGQFALPDPSNITGMPGYQAGLEAVQRSMAAQGFQGSGNMMAALQKYGGDFYNQYVNQRQGAAAGQLGAVSSQAGPIFGGLSSLALLSQGAKGMAGAF